jgi:hypothetical protein
MRNPHEKYMASFSSQGCFDIGTAVIAHTVEVLFLTVALSCDEKAPAYR